MTAIGSLLELIGLAQEARHLTTGGGRMNELYDMLDNSNWRTDLMMAGEVYTKVAPTLQD